MEGSSRETVHQLSILEEDIDGIDPEENIKSELTKESIGGAGIFGKEVQKVIAKNNGELTDAVNEFVELTRGMPDAGEMLDRLLKRLNS